MLYVLLLVFGFAGLVIMALMGSLRVGSHRGVGRGAHRGHAHHAARGAHAPKVGRGPTPAPARGGRLSRNFSWLLQGLSPIDLFAMAMGAGALGIVGRKGLHNETAAALMAVGGAILMDLLVVRPVFAMLLRFASNPSAGLEGTISQLAEAASAFDAKGKGLVKISLDGQTSQILATLEPGELASGVSVRKGDPLVVLEVDSARNICRVSREIATDD